MMFTNKIQKIACFTALAIAAACSDGKSTNPVSGFVVSEAAPSDSTGSTGTVNMNLTSLQSVNLSLAEAAPTTLTIGSNITLSYAKFNIAKIRVKSAKLQTEDDKTLETMEANEEKESVKEVEATTGESDAALMAKDDKTTKDKKVDRAAKIKENAVKLAAKEKADLKKESDRDKSTKFAGPYVYDAIAGKVEGEIPATSLTDGSYKRIEFQLKRNFSAAEDQAILGNVFAIRGTYMKAGVAVPFEIDWHVALNFRLSGDTAVSVAPAAANPLIIDFQLAKWFEGIDLSAATVDADGTIYINKSSNKAIMKILHHNIKVNAHFGKDADGDKKLSDAEIAGKGEEASDAVAE